MATSASGKKEKKEEKKGENKKNEVRCSLRPMATPAHQVLAFLCRKRKK